MPEGYLSVLINRQIPDSVWMEKGEKPLSGTEQAPFVVVFEQHFADADAAHKFVLGKLAGFGFEEWNGGQFKGPTTRDIINLLAKASQGEASSQPNHENLSLGDLPALTEPAANAHSNGYKLTPADYVLVGGTITIGLIVLFMAMQVDSPSQTVAEATVSEQGRKIADELAQEIHSYYFDNGQLTLPPVLVEALPDPDGSNIKQITVTPIEAGSIAWEGERMPAATARVQIEYAGEGQTRTRCLFIGQGDGAAGGRYFGAVGCGQPLDQWKDGFKWQKEPTQ